ncbi:DUF2280 domain-containing protein [Shewanella algae]|uniref:DUF2280 domain-containing protein n=1 Tax=Shewanella algae TaxID=38313 RepID=UPI001AAC77E2|nr:DUF2280 domain-containing protein [Shewanella algae]MBO2552604.1 DUF2280 domain-containing protein [Shewanella algae]MBO2578142.1 DUF2280 domain-containing protein [Shewanella algae]MBO2582496.1 DUF2280 domain-containing protein [Shewanella algae]
MASLSDQVKQFIVQSLACYDTPSQVAEAVKEEFGVVVPRQQVEAYNPTKYAGRNLSQKWRVVFDATREAFKAETADIPIAQRAYRLRKLEMMLSKAEKRGNYPLVMQMLEQAAKEVGDIYVNHKRQQSDDDDAPPQPVKVEISVKDARIRDDDKSGS